MEIKINKQKCIGCGTCCALCGEFFEMDNDNKSNVKKGKQGELKDVGCAKEAAEACPVQCINIKN